MGILAACIGAGPLGVINIGMIAELTSAGTAISISGALGMFLIGFFGLAFAKNLALDRQDFGTGTIKQMTHKLTLFLFCIFETCFDPICGGLDCLGRK